MLQKTVVSVDMSCSRCKKSVMKKLSVIEDIDSIVLDSSKRLVTTIGDADPAKIIKQLRKFRSSAAFVSVGPAKEEKGDKDKKAKDEKDSSLPKACSRCEVWYVIRDDDRYGYCSIL